jgi:hypothetical protein
VSVPPDCCPRAQNGITVPSKSIGTNLFMRRF